MAYWTTYAAASSATGRSWHTDFLRGGRRIFCGGRKFGEWDASVSICLAERQKGGTRAAKQRIGLTERFLCRMARQLFFRKKVKKRVDCLVQKYYLCRIG